MSRKRKRQKPESVPPVPRKSSGRTVLTAIGLAVLLVGGLIGLLCTRAVPSENDAPVETWEATASYPHDAAAFTQGLVWHSGHIYESTGQHGKSSVRIVDLASGRVLKQTDLPKEYFGEGIAVVENRVVQLTWQSKRGFLYRSKTLERIGEFQYEGEGWGLAFGGKRLVMSDGTARLRFLDPQTLRVVRELPVREGQRPIPLLNELEWVRGEIWANVWKRDRIACIDPESGRVTRWIDLSRIVRDVRTKHPRAGVLNGIAWDGDTDRVFVTGKNWPVMLRIQPSGSRENG